MQSKVKIISSNWLYDEMFTAAGWELVENYEEADLVQFTGGADVSPNLYGQENTGSYVSPERDAGDILAFEKAKLLAKPMAGICRGGQFLNVMSGGSMIQHVEGHAVGSLHKAEDLTSGKLIWVTSTHHQMMVPGKGGTVIMVANIVGERDTEAVFYPDTPALCFQPHPELFEEASVCRKTYFNYLRNFLKLS